MVGEFDTLESMIWLSRVALNPPKWMARRGIHRLAVSPRPGFKPGTFAAWASNKTDATKRKLRGLNAPNSMRAEMCASPAEIFGSVQIPPRGDPIGPEGVGVPLGGDFPQR